MAEFTIDVEPANSKDIASLTPLLRASFPGPFEAEVVEQIKQDNCPQLSVVLRHHSDQTDDDKAAAELIGQVFFSAVTVADANAAGGFGLGPMAIHPDWQRQGWGMKVLQESLARLAERDDASWVVVLGEPEFYSKAGFVPAEVFGLRCRYPVDSKYFMALELHPDALQDVAGTVDYHRAFGDPDELPVEPEQG